MEFKGTRILVTGGAGFIGSHLVDGLIEQAPEALGVIDNLFLGKERNLTHARRVFPDLRFFPESVADERALEGVLRDFKPDIVFNLATIPLPASIERPKWSYAENIAIGLNVLEFRRLGLFRHLIHFSTSEVYGSALTPAIAETHPRDSHTPYASSKAANDNLMEAYRKTFGIRTLILRPFNNYGPRQNEASYAGVIPKTIKNLMDGRSALIFGDGRQTRDFIFVKDCVWLTIEAARRDDLYGADYNLGSGREVEIGWLIQEICRLLDRPDHIESRPERPGDVRRHLADMSRLSGKLEMKPMTAFQDGLKRTIDWYKQRRLAADE